MNKIESVNGSAAGEITNITPKTTKKPVKIRPKYKYTNIKFEVYGTDKGSHVFFDRTVKVLSDQGTETFQKAICTKLGNFIRDIKGLEPGDKIYIKEV